MLAAELHVSWPQISFPFPRRSSSGRTQRIPILAEKSLLAFLIKKQIHNRIFFVEIGVLFLSALSFVARRPFRILKFFSDKGVVEKVEIVVRFGG